jgi:DNA-binding MarR family transcriptional regulator
MKTPKKDKPETAHHLIHRVGQTLDEVFTDRVKTLQLASSHELTSRQYVVLGIVDEFGSRSQTFICERSGIDRSTLADIVGRMVKRGLLHRKRSREDARAYSVNLTDAGKRLLDEAKAASAVTEAFVLERLGSASAVKQFIASLEKLKSRKGPEAEA